MNAMRVVTLLCVVLLAQPALAEAMVDYDKTVDFASYMTYAWREGTPAPTKEVQEGIVAAVDRELQARGLTKVEPELADLFVETVAGGVMDAGVRTNYVSGSRGYGGVLTVDVRNDVRGALVVDLLDAETEQRVWRAMDGVRMSFDDPSKVVKKVNKMTKKMFKSYPQ